MPLNKQKKNLYYARMTEILETYSKVFVVAVDNVGSQQMNSTRKAMRGQAEILMGKNTFMKKIMQDFLEKNPDSYYASLKDKITGNVGFVFTNADLPKIRDFILANRVPAPARVGAISPVDVVIPAGPTGCDPGQTSFFQVLQVPTKIVKGQIEITNPVNLIKIGDKVGSSEAALLTKLNIKPFSYGLSILCVFDKGSIYDVSVLDIDEAVLTARFIATVDVIASISLQLGYPTQASVAHTVANAFKSLVAVAVGLDNYTFKEAAPYKAYLADPSAFAAAAAPAAGAAAPAAAAAAPEEKVEEVDALEGGMNLFGGAAY